MFRGDRRINTHTHTHHPRHRGHPGRTSVDSHERALPSHRDEEHPGAPFPPESRHARELTNGGRAPSRGRSPIHAGNVASHALPTPRRWAPHLRRPCLWVIRCLPNVPPHTPAQQRERPIHQFPQPGLPGDRPRSAISFTSPKLTRKPPPPGSLPWSPYVATAPHRDAHQSYKPHWSPRGRHPNVVARLFSLGPGWTHGHAE